MQVIKYVPKIVHKERELEVPKYETEFVERVAEVPGVRLLEGPAPPVDGPSPGGNCPRSTTSGLVLVETELLEAPVDLVLVETAGINLVSVGLSWYQRTTLAPTHS